MNCLLGPYLVFWSYLVGLTDYLRAKATAKSLRQLDLALILRNLSFEGCDATLLLVSSNGIVTEKGLNPKKYSARGFEVLDEIKSALEKECPRNVFRTDIFALAARDAIVLAGRPNGEVILGKRDSRSANLSGSNNNIPAPNNTNDKF